MQAAGAALQASMLTVPCGFPCTSFDEAVLEGVGQIDVQSESLYENGEIRLVAIIHEYHNYCYDVFNRFTSFR